jgi:hypothetical protein
VDPEEIFSAIFGGERFVPIIGHISLGKDMKDALQNEDSDGEGKQMLFIRPLARPDFSRSSPNLI